MAELTIRTDFYGLASVAKIDTAYHCNDGTEGMFLGDRKAVVAVLDAEPDELAGDRTESILACLESEWLSSVYVDFATLREESGALVFEVVPAEIVEVA